MLMYPLIFVSYKNSLALCQKKRRMTYVLATALQAIQIRALEHKVPQFPAVVPISLLPHPAVVIVLADLFKDTLSLFQGARDLVTMLKVGTGHVGCG